MIAALAIWTFIKFPFLNEAGAVQSAVARPLPVNVMTVEFVDSIKQSRTFTGTIRAQHRSDLGFELSGKISEVFVDEGDRISTGVEIPVSFVWPSKSGRVERR